MNNKRRTPGALYPYDDLDMKERKTEWKMLTKALEDDRITNIAVTAPYDTGKSSFLLSFFIQRRMKQLEHSMVSFINKKLFNKKTKGEYYRKIAEQNLRQGKTDFKFIEFPNFFEKNSDDKDIEIELEKNIIEQLILTVNPRRLPDSNIKRIVPLKFQVIFLFYIALWLLIGIIKDWKITFSSNLVWNIVALFLIFIFGLFGISYLMHFLNRATFTLTANWQIGGASIKTNLTSKSGEYGNDKFIEYNDELQYYFEKTKLKYVIFEDLDRYNTPIIFQRLRALNKRLNSLTDNSIVFIYTLKDSVFASRDSTKDVQLNLLKLDNRQNINDNFAAVQEAKFFDYIIPIIPIVSFKSSKQVFKEEIAKYNFFKDKEKKKGKNKEKKETYYLQITDSMINGLGNFIFDKREICSIILELYIRAKNLPLEFFKKKLVIDRLLAAIIYKNQFPKDYENIYVGKSKVSFLMKNRELLINEIVAAKADKKENLLNSPISLLMMEVEHSNINIKNEELQNSIDFVLRHPLLRFLVYTNLIDNTFEDYISPDPYGNLLTQEKEFIRLVLSHFNSLEEYDIPHYQEVVKELNQSYGANYYSAYSIQILTYLLKDNQKEHAQELILGIKRKDKREEHEKYKFILEAINYQYNTVKLDNNARKNLMSPLLLLGELLFKNWKGFLNSPYTNLSVLDKKEKKEIISFELDYIINAPENQGRQFADYLRNKFNLDNELCRDVYYRKDLEAREIIDKRMNKENV